MMDGGARIAISAERIVEELAKIAFADVAEAAAPDAHGTPPIEPSKQGADESAEVEMPTAEEAKPKPEIGGRAGGQESKRLALMALGRQLGLFEKPPKPPKLPAEPLPLKDRLMSKEEWI